MTQKKPTTNTSEALSAARVALQIIELLEPVRSLKAKIALLHAAELLCDATALEGGIRSRIDEDEVLTPSQEAALRLLEADEDEDEEAAVCSHRLDCCDEADCECQLCEQEQDLEPGSFTPHEHMMSADAEHEAAHAALDRLMVPR